MHRHKPLNCSSRAKQIWLCSQGDQLANTKEARHSKAGNTTQLALNGYYDTKCQAAVAIKPITLEIQKQDNVRKEMSIVM